MDSFNFVLEIGKSICAFNRDTSKIFVVSSEGTFTGCTFLDGGECSRVSVAKILGYPRTDDDEDIGLAPVDMNTIGSGAGESSAIE